MAAQRDSKGRFVKGGSKPNKPKGPPKIRKGKKSGFWNYHIENDLEELMRAAKRKLPIAFESSMLEAAEVAAFHLDKATRLLLNKTGRSTGALANSWRATVIKTSNMEFLAGAFSDLPYASIHETGGTITPKNTKLLAVPVTDKAFKVGSPRNMSGLRYVPAVGRRSAVFVGDGMVQYALPKSVDIPSTGYISFATAAAAPDIEQIIGNNTVDVLAGFDVYEVK